MRRANREGKDAVQSPSGVEREVGLRVLYAWPTRRRGVAEDMALAIVLATGLTLLSMIPSRANAGVVVDQSSGQTGKYIQSQDFPDIPMYDVAVFDNFTIGSAVSLTSLTVFGSDFYGNPANNLAVIAGIYASPDRTTAPILSANGVEVFAGGANLLFDFGGATLPAGSYWLSARIVRPNSQAGWYWRMRLPITGSQAIWHNPGGGFGLGTAPIGMGNVLEESDLAFILQGDPAVIPTSPTASATSTLPVQATPTATASVAIATATNVPGFTNTRTPTRTATPPAVATSTLTRTRTRTPTRTFTPPSDGDEQGGSGGQGQN